MPTLQILSLLMMPAAGLIIAGVGLLWVRTWADDPSVPTAGNVSASNRSTSHYIALIHKDADSGYGVSFPDVPGIIAVADTLDEALAEAGTALAFAFKYQAGKISQPRNLDALRRDPQFLDRSADAIVAAVAPVATLAHAALAA